MNRLVTGIVATLMIFVTVAWWMLLVKGATWLISDRTDPPAVVAGSKVGQNTPQTSASHWTLRRGIHFLR